MRSATTIKKLREDLCLDPKEFADLIEMSRFSVWHYENGTRKPRLRVVRKMIELAKKHGIKLSPKDFLG